MTKAFEFDGLIFVECGYSEYCTYAHNLRARVGDGYFRIGHAEESAAFRAEHPSAREVVERVRERVQKRLVETNFGSNGLVMQILNEAIACEFPQEPTAPAPCDTKPVVNGGTRSHSIITLAERVDKLEEDILAVADALVDIWGASSGRTDRDHDYVPGMTKGKTKSQFCKHISKSRPSSDAMHCGKRKK